MRPIICLLILSLSFSPCWSQDNKIWTEDNRQFLIQNLERTKSEIINATDKLTPAQWAFKPAPDKWSIGQVLEHLGLYERIFEQEADIMLSADPEPWLDSLSLSDSAYLSWMDDPNPHTAERNATPLGYMKGQDNLSFFLFGRENILSFIRDTKSDLKSHFTFRWGKERRRSIHALMVVHFGHTDRHLKQIERIKSSKGYPLK